MLLFCNFLISSDILNLGCHYAERCIHFEQAFGILLQQYHGDWDQPCNSCGSFPGDGASANRSKELAFNFHVGLGTFLFRYLPGLLHSILMEMGISEDMYYPLAIFLLAFIAFAGAWMGFWAVRSFVLTEDGSVDISTSHFVAWSIRVLAVVLIIQSSLDPLLAAEALICGIIVSSILRRIFRWRFLRRMYKKLFKLARNINRESLVPDLSPFGGSGDKYKVERPEGSKLLSPRAKQFNLASCNSMKGSSRTSRHQLSDSDVYPSTFHTTPERREFSKDSWEKFTRESTQKAVKELVSSPDFSKWAAANAERITVTPNSTTSTSRQQRRKWFLWS